MYVFDDQRSVLMPGGDYGHYRSQQGVTHWGIDLWRPDSGVGDVRSPVNGEVVRAGMSLGYHPNVVVIRSDDQRGPSGNPVYHIFGHLSKGLPAVGSRVLRGQVVGRVASSAEIQNDPQRDLRPEQRRMPPHVHWEIAEDTHDPLQTDPSRRIRFDPVTWWKTGRLERIRGEGIRPTAGPPFWLSGLAGLALAVMVGLAALAG